MVALASPEICLATPSGTPKIQPFLWQQGVRSDSIPPTPHPPAVQYCQAAPQLPITHLSLVAPSLDSPWKILKAGSATAHTVVNLFHSVHMFNSLYCTLLFFSPTISLECFRTTTTMSQFMSVGLPLPHCVACLQ